MKVLYLAHRLTTRKKMRDWQLKMEREYNIRFTNPFYNRYRQEIEILDLLKTHKERLAYKKTLTPQQMGLIVRLDLDMIRKSDGVVAFLTTGDELGTIMEIFYASHVLHIPVYVITRDETKFVHPWIMTYATKMFKTHRQFEKFLCHYVGKRKKGHQLNVRM